MSLIFRNNDGVLKQKDQINLYSFKKFPIFIGCTNKEKKLDPVAIIKAVVYNQKSKMYF